VVQPLGSTANGAIFEALKAAEIDIPFPQREIKILNKG
jgi:small-conductance mechanosensitive channel